MNWPTTSWIISAEHSRARARRTRQTWLNPPSAVTVDPVVKLDRSLAQKHRGIGDLDRIGEAAQRDRGDAAGTELVDRRFGIRLRGQCVASGGGRGPGHDDVDPDVAVGEFVGPGAGQGP